MFINKVRQANFKVCLAGNIEKEILDTLVKEFTLSRIIYKGYLVHRKVISLMKSSQLLINILAEMKHSNILIFGKQMEYIATGNPILCIGNTEGESAHLLGNIHNARVFEKKQIEESAEFLIDLYKNWENGLTCINNVEDEDIKSKSRLETTRELARILNQV